MTAHDRHQVEVIYHNQIKTGFILYDRTEAQINNRRVPRYFYADRLIPWEECLLITNRNQSYITISVDDKPAVVKCIGSDLELVDVIYHYHLKKGFIIYDQQLRNKLYFYLDNHMIPYQECKEKFTFKTGDGVDHLLINGQEPTRLVIYNSHLYDGWVYYQPIDSITPELIPKQVKITIITETETETRTDEKVIPADQAQLIDQLESKPLPKETGNGETLYVKIIDDQPLRETVSFKTRTETGIIQNNETKGIVYYQVKDQQLTPRYCEVSTNDEKMYIKGFKLV